MSEKTPQIPSIHGLPDDVKNIIKPMKEILETREGRLGTNKSTGVTYEKLVELGLITEDQIP